MCNGQIVKVRLQTQPPSAEAGVAELYLGPTDCFKKIVRGEGVLALWKGVTPALGSAVIENAVLFSANGVVRRLYLSVCGDRLGGEQGRHLTVSERAAVGGLSGVVSAMVILRLLRGVGTLYSPSSLQCITPAEMIKCRTQIQHNSKKALYVCSSTLQL